MAPRANYKTKRSLPRRDQTLEIIIMAKKYENHVSWREKRQHRDPLLDPKKSIKANRERFRRSKKATFKRANDIFIDSLDTGRDRHIYVLVMSQGSSGVRYSTYDSHPREKWVPAAEDVVCKSWLVGNNLTNNAIRRRNIGPEPRKTHHQTLRTHAKRATPRNQF